jgi:hypothetical protein
VTVTKREILTVTSRDDDPKSMIDALLEMPQAARLVDIEHEAPLRNWTGHRFGTVPVTFTFERKATDE